MAAATITSVLTLEEYLHTSYRPDREFIDGELEERNLGEYEHGVLQMEIGYWFRLHRDAWRVRVVAEQRTRVSAERVRIPDVCVLSLEARKESVRVTPPLLCIEILSPEDRLTRTIAVMRDYLAMGVQHLWIVDPIGRVAYRFTPAGLLAVEGDRLTIPGTPIYLDLPTLFAALD